ncbi:MAG: TIGR02996 domain-containing protein [Myxococcota bacterium]
MRRYRHDDQLWEVAANGHEVRIRTGPVGGELREEIRPFRTELRALWEVDRLSAEHSQRGYVLIARDDPRPEQSADFYGAAFAQALRDRPDDIDHYLVYSDWLLSQGDPRGELIAVQHALLSQPAADPRRRELERKEYTLLAKHRRQLWGALGEQVVDIDTQNYAADLFAADWYLGFIRTARLELLDFALPSLAGIMDEFLALDATALLRELTIVEQGQRDAASYGELLTALGERAPTTLHSLSCGDPDDWDRIPRLALPASPRLAGLRHLALCADEVSIDLDEPESAGSGLAAAVESLQLTAARDLDRLAETLARVRWPALRQLSLCGSRDALRYHQLQFPAGVLGPVLTGASTPALSALTIHGSEDTDHLCQVIATSPLGARLRHLDLSYGTMSATGVQALLSGDLSGLDTLSVSNNYLRGADIKRLKQVVPKLKALPQRR